MERTNEFVELLALLAPSSASSSTSSPPNEGLLGLPAIAGLVLRITLAVDSTQNLLLRIEKL